MPRAEPVTEVMTSPVITVSPTTTLEEAVGLLARNSISGAPVVDGEGRLVGLLDDDDLLVAEARLHGPTMLELFGAYIPLPGERRRFEEDVRHALARTVAEVMDDDPPRVGLDAIVEDVATLMVDRDVSRVPVVDINGEVVGIVTRGDLVQAMYRPED
ncbi:MAG TPA: CBS domain-containing protein [Egibacteraceae bacterium]|nr:CBS domain-containing protein [Egibacteraceae bacterium]